MNSTQLTQLFNLLDDTQEIVSTLPLVFNVLVPLSIGCLSLIVSALNKTGSQAANLLPNLSHEEIHKEKLNEAANELVQAVNRIEPDNKTSEFRRSLFFPQNVTDESVLDTKNDNATKFSK